MSPRSLPLVFLAILAVSGTAQKPGDAGVTGFVTVTCPNILVMHVNTATGGARTLFWKCPYPSSRVILPAPENRGVVFSMENWNTFKHSLYQYWQGRITTLGTIPWADDMIVDQRGDFILLSRDSQPNQPCIYRFSPAGGLATLATGIIDAIAIEEDPVRGDYLVATGQGDVLWVTHTGWITTLSAGIFPANKYRIASMCTEITTGKVLVAWDEYTYRYDPIRGNAEKLPAGCHGISDLDHDPIGGNYLGVYGNAVVRFDPQTGASLILSSFESPFTITTHVTTWGRRMLTGMGCPMPGSVYPITLAMPGEGGKAYQAAASFAARPGIPTSAGRIYINPDDLFHLSLRAPDMFRRFPGFLDANGNAQLAVKIPAFLALQGRRFFVVAVSYESRGIRRISQPLAVTIE